MRISVKDPSENLNLNIVLPSALLYGRVTAKIVCALLNSHVIDKYLGDDFSKKSLTVIKSGLRECFAALRKTKKKFPKLILVDVETAEGEKIVITL